MRTFSLASLVTTLPVLCMSALPPRCTGSASVTVTDPRTGLQGTAKVEWSKDTTTAKINTTIPPNAPSQTITVGGFKFQLPANPSNQPMPFTAECTDPVVVQVPLSWSLAFATVTTPAGSGPMVITTTPIPAAATIAPDGSVTFSTFYAPEAGAKLLMGDYPAGLAVDGMTSGAAMFRFPAGPSGLHVLKFVSAGKVTLFTKKGPVTWYPPIDPYETDFSRVSYNANVIVADAVDGTVCKNMQGTAPEMVMPASDWKLGTTTSLDAGALVPGSAVAFVLGIHELNPPLPFGAGGCKLRVDPKGAVILSTSANAGGGASIPIRVPNMPGLVGWALAAQAVELDLPSTIAFSNHLKPRIER